MIIVHGDMVNDKSKQRLAGDILSQLIYKINFHYKLKANVADKGIVDATSI